MWRRDGGLDRLCESCTLRMMEDSGEGVPGRRCTRCGHRSDVRTTPHQGIFLCRYCREIIGRQMETVETKAIPEVITGSVEWREPITIVGYIEHAAPEKLSGVLERWSQQFLNAGVRAEPVQWVYGLSVDGHVQGLVGRWASQPMSLDEFSKALAMVFGFDRLEIDASPSLLAELSLVSVNESLASPN